MTATELASYAANKGNFETIQDYIDFCRTFLAFVEGGGMHGTVISRNENHYFFYQYARGGAYKISRPVNRDLMYSAADEQIVANEFLRVLHAARDLPLQDAANRSKIRNSIYTIQQSIGIALDAYAESNRARKVAGDLFERLIRLLISSLGVDCKSGTIGIPVVVQGVEEFQMSYQHDLVIRRDGHLKILGSVKTSSKDRMDKVFIDKFLYSKLTETKIPHIAIFLNDVQRKGKEPNYGINATFLPGHFKGYSIKLNTLDGVYYCDLRPNMRSDPFLQAQICPIDLFFSRDLWKFLAEPHPDVEQHEPTPINLIEPKKEVNRKRK